jgi:hypothetical protein
VRLPLKQDVEGSSPSVAAILAMNKTPRSVRVYIGRPEGLEDSDLEEEEQHLSPDECFTIEFTEDGGEEGFSAQTVCLCALSAATMAWLTGKSEEEVQAIMVDHPDQGHDDAQVT